MNIKYDQNEKEFSRKKILIAEGIKQAWNRRFHSNIHSGVRVKIPSERKLIPCYSKLPLFQQTNRMQSILQRAWIESETSALSQNGQKKLFNSFPTKTIRINRHVNSIGIQTTMIRQIDRQTSCDIVQSTRIFRQNGQSSSSNSSSESSKSDESSLQSKSISTDTSTSSSETSEHDEDYPLQYRQNKNRNNNAIEPLPNNEQILQIMDGDKLENIYEVKPAPGKKRFFGSFFNLFSFLRLSSWKNDRVCISPATVGSPITSDTSRNRSITSRCRRSAARNMHHNSSIPNPSEGNISSFVHSIEKKSSKQSISINRQVTDPRLQASKMPSYQSMKNSRNMNHRKSSYRKTNHRNRHHKRNYSRRQKKQKHIRLSQQSSHSTCSSQLKTSSINHQPNAFLDESKSRSPPTNLTDNKSIRLRVKNKNLLSTLSKSQISPLSIDPMDNSLRLHQMNTINEYKSILQRIKATSRNNNSSPSTKNQNINQSSNTSLYSSESASMSTASHSITNPQRFQTQNEIIREGISQLIRYQNLSKSYQLKSNPTINQFLMKSTALFPESLHRLSLINEPNSLSKK